MGFNIQISEKDIFDYVFQPEKLGAEKFRLIEQEKSLLNRILYYEEMKKSFQESEPDERLLKKIKKKISPVNQRKSVKKGERDNSEDS